MASGQTRRALGRGLTNLIPQDSEETGSNNDVVMVDSNSILPNPFQPRKEFNPSEIEGLAESIKTQGLLQPIILRKKVDGYEIISGERRFRALKQLGQDKIPSIIKAKITDREMIEMALVENIQRENLSDIEQAIAFQRLLLECGLSHEELSARVGKSRSAITNTLRLLKLPEEIQQMVVRGELSMGHARAILSFDTVEKQKEIAGRIVSQRLSVREVEAAAQRVREPPPRTKGGGPVKKGAETDPNMLSLIEKLQYKFGTMVSIVNLQNNKGKVEIHYYSKDDLNRIADLLIG
jgi:ParB family transcriptional regulator, chromosome partitioning protein